MRPITYPGAPVRARELSRRRVMAAVEASANAYQVPAPLVLDPTSRKRAVVAARWAAMRALKRDVPDASLSAIARAFGMDHTTVIHCMKRGDALPYSGRRG